MTAHVAEATEGRGRVILRFSAWEPSDAAIEAAVLVARAFQSEVEVLLVEDTQRTNFAALPFAVEFSLRDGRPRQVSTRDVYLELRSGFKALRKRVAAITSGLEVPTQEHVVRDDPVQALVSACARRGPWNMIVLAEKFQGSSCAALDEAFTAVADATGIIVAGPKARFEQHIKAMEGAATSTAVVHRENVPTGPVVLVLEDSERFASMVRAARRIADAIEVDTIVLLVAETEEELARMDSEVRLALADNTHIHLARTHCSVADQMAAVEAIRRLHPGFVIVPYGGISAPRGRNLHRLTGALASPVLLVR